MIIYILILNDTAGECTGPEIKDMFILSVTLRPQVLSSLKTARGSDKGNCHGS